MGGLSDLLSLQFWIFMVAYSHAIALLNLMVWDIPWFSFFAHNVHKKHLPYFTDHGMDHYARQAKTALAFLIISIVLRVVAICCVVACFSKKSFGRLWYSSVALLACLLTSLSAINAAWLWKWHIYFEENEQQRYADDCIMRASWLIIELSMFALLILCMLYLFTAEYIARWVADSGPGAAAQTIDDDSSTAPLLLQESK
ncbi:hypothetical protein MGN70_013933 [Eutypa lata]|nr:hypothetical protein MGN70_013933 [Eutypa lata]